MDPPVFVENKEVNQYVRTCSNLSLKYIEEIVKSGDIIKINHIFINTHPDTISNLERIVDTIWRITCDNEYIDVAKLLLKINSETHNEIYGIGGIVPIMEASRNGRLEIVKLLIPYYVNLDENIIRKSCRCFNDVKDDISLSITVASQNGHTTVIKLLLKHGKCEHLSASLLGAVPNNHIDVVKLLLENEADSYIHDSKDFFLRCASKKGFLEIVNLLLKYGADVHAEDDEALQEASSHGHLEIVRILLEYGTDVHADDNEALKGASSYGYLEIVRILLEHGADPHAGKADAGEGYVYGEDSLDLALEEGYTDVIKLLQEYY